MQIAGATWSLSCHDNFIELSDDDLMRGALSLAIDVL